MKVTRASPCCQPSPMSCEPQYWHLVTGTCVIAFSPLCFVGCKHTMLRDDSEVQRMLLLKMEKIRDEEIAIRIKALCA